MFPKRHFKNDRVDIGVCFFDKHCHFLLLAQKKVTKEKGTTNAAHLRAFSRPPACTLANARAWFAPHRSWTPTHPVSLVK